MNIKIPGSRHGQIPTHTANKSSKSITEKGQNVQGTDFHHSV